METLRDLSEPHDDSSGANPSSVKSDDGSPTPDGDRGSPPPNCAICLGRCRNKSFTDSCLHQFCFKCLVTWSKVKSECPLCKQNFKSIIHNVQSNQQYEEYRVEQRRQGEDRIDIDDLVTATRRFRYRTTLTIPRGGEHMALQRLLMHYPPLSAMVGMSRNLPHIAPAALPSSRRRRSPSSFRRTVYRHNLWARPLPDFTGRHRDCSPQFYRYNNSQMHRLVPWLNRELHYLLLENAGHITYVLSRILELLPQYHITSPEFREDMYRYFGTRTDHFLHELHCFASTPYDLTGYDRNVQYTTDSRISNYTVNDVLSSSDTESGDSDIVLVTPQSAPTATSRSRSTPPHRPVSPLLPIPFEGPGPSARRPPEPVYPQNHITSPIEAARLARTVIPIETISNSDTDDDEVMVTGYIKPPNQRTPEVVDLRDSDDSDVVVTEVPPAPEPRSYVKLTLSRPRAAASDSEDGDATYTPPHAPRSSSSDSPRSSPCSSPCSSPRMRSRSPRTPSPHRVHYERALRLRRDAGRMPDDSRGARRKCNRRSGDGERGEAPVDAPATPLADPSPANDGRTPEAERREKERRKKSKSTNGKGVKSSRRDTATDTEPSRAESGVREEPQPEPSSSRSVERKKSTRCSDAAVGSRTSEPAAREEPRPVTSRPAEKSGKSSRRNDGAEPRRDHLPVEVQQDPEQGSSSRPSGRLGKVRRDEAETQRATSSVQEDPEQTTRSTGKVGKARRVEVPSSVREDSEPGPSTRPSGTVRKIRRDIRETQRANTSSIQENTDQGTSSRPRGRVGPSSKEEASSSVKEDPERGLSSRASGRVEKTRGDEVEPQRTENLVLENPKLGSTRPEKVGKTLKAEADSQRAESSTEARPGSSRAVPNILKRKNTGDVPARRNSRDTKRLKSVVKKTSSWSSSASSSSSAASSSSSAASSSSSAAFSSSSAVRSSSSARTVPVDRQLAVASSRTRRRSSSCDSPREPLSPDFFTDSDDDIPLNLTIQRSGGQP